MFLINMNRTTRVIVSLSPYLKEKLMLKSDEYGCSQAEILRMGLIRLLEVER